MIVSITGPIGSGKTTLLRRLQERNDYAISEEPADEWVRKGWLDDYYDDQERFGLWFQLEVIKSQIEAALQHTEGKVMVIERSPLDGLLIFGKQLCEQGTMPGREYDLLCFFAERSWRPDALIILDVPTETMVERIKSRDRVAEQGIDTHYYDQIRKRYDALQQLPLPTLVLEPYELDALDSICEKVEAFIASFA